MGSGAQFGVEGFGTKGELTALGIYLKVLSLRVLRACTALRAWGLELRFKAGLLG